MATDAAPVPPLTAPPTSDLADADDVGDAERRITRQFAIFVSAGYLVYLGLTFGDIINSFAVAPPWWASTAAVVIFGSGAAVGVAGRWGSMASIRVCVVVASTVFLLTVLTWFLVWNGHRIDTPRALYFSQFFGVPALALAVSFRARWALIYLAVLSVAVSEVAYLVRAPGYGSPLMPEIAWSFGFSMIFVLAASMGIRTSRILDETRAGTYRLATAAAAAEARDAERVRFDALTHDGVMSTLLGAARQGNTPAITAQAQLTITKLGSFTASDGDDPVDAGAAVAQIRGTIAEIDDTIAVDVLVEPGTATVYPADTVRTMCGAAGEAVRNSRRHAGHNAEVRVDVLMSESAMSVTISDNGVGFDPTTIPGHRLGIAVSIRGRMQRLSGGSATVDTSRGHGTRVQLVWAAP